MKTVLSVLLGICMAGVSLAGDDTARVQSFIDALQVIPAGEYDIDGGVGLRPLNESTLDLNGVRLKVIPNALQSYAIIRMQGLTGVKIVGGTIIGDKLTHAGTAGEWGMGIDMRGCSAITISGTRIETCWGDGLYLSKECTAITIGGVTCTGNRRQGLTATSVDGLTVENCTFEKTSGALPMCGIDLEPNAGETVANVLIRQCQLTGNSGSGLSIGTRWQNVGTTFIRGVRIEDCRIEDNQHHGIAVTTVDGLTVLNCRVSANARTGITVGMLGNEIIRSSIQGVRIEGCLMAGHGRYGLSNPALRLSSVNGVVVLGNTLRDNTGLGVVDQFTRNTKYENNSITGTRTAGTRFDAAVVLDRSTGVILQGNSITDNAVRGLVVYRTRGTQSGNTFSRNTGANKGSFTRP